VPRPTSNLDRLRAICLGLPEAEERETWGEPTMRVRNKIFAFPRDQQVTVKADPEERESLLADPRFFLPPYVGSKGWVGLRLDGPAEPDWGEVRELVTTSYRLIAPKRLSAQIG
jgi:predicted DNA-binding protein (MmcQ/YjbR family)